MDRRTTTWFGAGCLVLLVLLALPIGLAIWFFSNNSLGNLMGGVPNVTQNVPQERNTQRASNPSPSIPETGQTGNRPGVEIGNLAVPLAQAPESLAELYKTANPGAVSISVFVNQGGILGGGAGSGFILTDNGYIATNHHVVEGADTVYVTFFNQVTLQADVIGSDPDSDLAIIKVDELPPDTHPLPLGDSSQAQVGDPVVAIGNPYGLGTSMTYGIVSAVGRVIPSGFTQYNIPQAIQTDAAINPGNSGGPLINMNGEVIGVNAQIRTSGEGGGNIGIGFAVPSNILNMIYPALIEQGDYVWPYLGVSGGTISPQLVQQFNLDPNQRGAFIGEVVNGGPADAAGLRSGDVILQADDQTINNFDDLLSYVAFSQLGDTITLTVLRDGEQFQTQATLAERPEGSGVQ